MPLILQDEPDRGSQICGHQTTYGFSAQFCGEFKAPGLYFCQEHHDWVMDECGEVRMAPGNARGAFGDEPPLTRHVPTFSGEGAIYSPEYLIRREGNAYGADPGGWRFFVA